MKKTTGRWWNHIEKKFIPANGYEYSHPGFDEFRFVVHEKFPRQWAVTEQETGCYVGQGLTRKAAIESTFRTLRGVSVEDFTRQFRKRAAEVHPI